MQFSFRGADVYYEDIGEGQPVVLLHGWGGHFSYLDNLHETQLILRAFIGN